MGDPSAAIPGAILRVLVGSQAYGTNPTGEGDRDEVVVFVELPEVALGMSTSNRSRHVRTQPDGAPSGAGDVDVTVHSLRKFVHLCFKGNPNALEVLFAPVLEAAPTGLKLREVGPARLLSRSIFTPYLGYIESQMKDLPEKGRPELIAAHGYDTKSASHAVRLATQCLELALHGTISFPVPEHARRFIADIRAGRVSYSLVASYMAVAVERIRGAEVVSTLRRPDPETVNHWLAAMHFDYWAEAGILDPQPERGAR